MGVVALLNRTLESRYVPVLHGRQGESVKLDGLETSAQAHETAAEHIGQPVEGTDGDFVPWYYTIETIYFPRSE